MVVVAGKLSFSDQINSSQIHYNQNVVTDKALLLW